MNKEAWEALEGSIAKWEAIVAGTGTDQGTTNCPLCTMFFEGRCGGCPVAESVGDAECSGTPYSEWRAAAHKTFGRHLTSDWYATTPQLVRLAQAELDFLKSLRGHP
jgi:hypothetical protein